MRPLKQVKADAAFHELKIMTC